MMENEKEKLKKRCKFLQEVCKEKFEEFFKELKNKAGYLSWNEAVSLYSV